MIKLTKGNILTANAEALVNTVNTKGVMGKGIALQFKKAFPDVFYMYKKACDAGEIQVGKVQVCELNSNQSPRYIINFPTKNDWKKPSRIEYIKNGLEALIDVIKKNNIRSIAIPALGCGQGGLKWEDVLPLIASAFEKISDVNVLLYPPQKAPASLDMPNTTQRPKMTPGRAMVLKLLGQYCVLGYELTFLEIQKLLYFLQEAGEPLKLNFAKHHYGPYADNVRHVLSRFEGHYTTGFGAGDSSPRTPIQILPQTLAEIDNYLDENHATAQEYNARLERVKKLITGFESPLGMELLATVHWVVKHENVDADGYENIICKIQEWNQRKKNSMRPEYIRVAIDRLKQEKWI